MQTSRPILSALGIVATIFGVSVVATLVAAQYGYSSRMVGWITLLGMIAFTWQSRATIGRLLGEPRLARAVARRPYRRP